jgi:hypothetical protein
MVERRIRARRNQPEAGLVGKVDDLERGHGGATVTPHGHSGRHTAAVWRGGRRSAAAAVGVLHAVDVASSPRD